MVHWTTLRRCLLGDKSRSVLPPRFRLPALPTVIIEFSRKAKDPEVSPAELARVIETDSGITCELLRYVNSSATGLKHKVSSAHQAMALLGVRPARLVLLCGGLKRALQPSRSRLFDFRDFWATNLERALLAREVARLLDADTELAFAGGLLQDFLLPVLTEQRLSTYLRYLEQPTDCPRPLTEFEQEQFGWDHATAAAHLMLAWGFPDDLICCVLLHHRGTALLFDPELGRTAAAAVAVAALVPDSIHQVPGGLDELVDLDRTWPSLRLLDAAERVQEDFEGLMAVCQTRRSFVDICREALTPSG